MIRRLCSEPGKVTVTGHRHVHDIDGGGGARLHERRQGPGSSLNVLFSSVKSRLSWRRSPIILANPAASPVVYYCTIVCQTTRPHEACAPPFDDLLRSFPRDQTPPCTPVPSIAQTTAIMDEDGGGAPIAHEDVMDTLGIRRRLRSYRERVEESESSERESAVVNSVLVGADPRPLHSLLRSFSRAPKQPLRRDTLRQAKKLCWEVC
jgi:hypothetical protein